MALNNDFLIPIESDKQISKIPTFLLDVSGSTNDKFENNESIIKSKLHYRNYKSVLEYEFDLMLNMCQKNNYENMNLILWSTEAKLYKNISINDIFKIMSETKSEGGTSISCVTNMISDDLFNNDENIVNPLIILTDGEINDNDEEVKILLNKLNNYNIIIQIIAVECNHKNYYIDNNNFGNELYRVIKKFNLSRLVNKFSTYNRLKTEFINMENPLVKNGFIPYDGKMFEKNRFNDFFQHIVVLVNNIIENNKQIQETKQNKKSEVDNKNDNKNYKDDEKKNNDEDRNEDDEEKDKNKDKDDEEKDKDEEKDEDDKDDEDIKNVVKKRYDNKNYKEKYNKNEYEDKKEDEDEEDDDDDDDEEKDKNKDKDDEEKDKDEEKDEDDKDDEDIKNVVKKRYDNKNYKEKDDKNEYEDKKEDEDEDDEDDDDEEDEDEEDEDEEDDDDDDDDEDDEDDDDEDDDDEEDEDEKKDEDKNNLFNKLLYVIQKLSLSIYYIVKDECYNYQCNIINLFCNIFKETEYYEKVRQILNNELNNLKSGKFSTFNEIKRQKQLKTENSNLELIENTLNACIKNNKNNNNYYSSFLLKDTNNKFYVITKSQLELQNMRKGTITYYNSSFMINNFTIPIMFDYDNDINALQWIKYIYSIKYNISITNEHLYYYILCDSLIANNNLYKKYANLVLNDTRYMSDITILQHIKKNNQVNIPFNVLANASKNINIPPLILYYLVIKKYIFKHTDNYFLDSVRTFCFNEIHENIKNNYEDNDWNIIENLLDDYLDNYKVTNISIVDKDMIKIMKHNYQNTNIECSLSDKMIEKIELNICPLCKNNIDIINIDKHTSDVNIIFDNNIQSSILNHIDLGTLDGINDYVLISPDTFNNTYNSWSFNNTCIIDPLSSAQLKITSQEEFIKNVNAKYPFLKNINMNNVALCGGFPRSILLKQQMKDFDFFLYGLENEDAYIKRVQTLAQNITQAIKTDDPTLKYCILYKPLFNVIEMIFYKDPNNHIKEDFTLDYFDKYNFKTMKKFTGEPNNDITRYLPDDQVNNSFNILDPRHNNLTSIIEPKNKINDNEINKANDNKKSYAKIKVDPKYYFEDNDEHGIKMVHRVQIVLCKYNTVSDIFKSFDLMPAMLAYTNNRLYFTNKSLLALQLMINEININGGTDLVKARVNKYFKYGFSIVFPNTSRQWNNKNYDNDDKQENMHYGGTNENISPLSFKVRMVKDNLIFINHGSNYENLLERNEQLETEELKQGRSLYISHLFCSFVSVLRYVKINDINYSFPVTDDYELFQNDKMNLNNCLVKIRFLEKQESIYNTIEWYPIFVKSILLNNY
ncbi:hypothetical protein Hokovirus_1_183 [Hokovirus HKV1]|uniref:VWFA domain-containing protein n=1 Tax=Hokovirus HKV1 TaxID=1977638 RepID=A0A1V0SF85_9VIRU|nr:hypothetical protein Hokovirus_1_183 [Hokovirus HKV1]